MSYSHISLRQEKFTPVNAQTVLEAADYTSDAFSLNGMNQLDLYVDYTHAVGGGTALTFTLYLSDVEAGTKMFQDTSAVETAGLSTLSLHTETIAISASGTFHFAFKQLNAMSGKLKVHCTAGTTDKVTVRAIRAVV